MACLQMLERSLYFSVAFYAVGLQLSGRSGEIVGELYIASGKDGKKFEAITKQLEVSRDES